jgi:hypothetical protein
MRNKNINKSRGGGFFQLKIKNEKLKETQAIIS